VTRLLMLIRKLGGYLLLEKSPLAKKSHLIISQAKQKSKQIFTAIAAQTIVLAKSRKSLIINMFIKSLICKILVTH